MKIILLNPLWSFKKYLPLNLTELAGYIRHYSHHTVSIIDLNYELQEYMLLDDMMDRAVEIVHSQDPDIIGLSCNTIHVPFCVEFCKRYKKKYKTPIVLGGIHPTSSPKDMFSLTGADYIVRGEGEETLLELLNCIEQKQALHTIRGLSYRQKNKIYHNPERSLIKDLSILPFPAFDLILSYVNGTQSKNLDEVQYCASRGCPFGCIFCSANQVWKYQRRKPVKQVIKELLFLKNACKIACIQFWDDCLPLNHIWFGELMIELKKINIEWGCLSRIDVLNHNLLKKMRESGCKTIYHGMESGSDRLRKLLSKKINPNINNRSMASLISKEIDLGITPTCSFMVGIPTETKKEFYETIDFAYKLKMKGTIIQFWIMTPYPDTRAVRMYKNQLIKVDRWKRLQQTDVNTYDQFFLYRGFYERYYKLNPDYYMFKPKMKLKDFFTLYREGRDKLIGHSESYFVGKLYDYIKEKGNKKYFIGIEEKFRLKDTRKNNRKTAVLIKIQNVFFNHSAQLIERLKILKPRNCFISLDLTKKDFLKYRKSIYMFLQTLKDNHIKFILTKPIPPLNNPEQGFSQCAPKNCAECYELFKISKEGEIVLCTGKILFKEYSSLYRSLIYYFFLRLGVLEPRYQSSCYNFPKNKKVFIDLMQKYNKSNNYLDLAQKYLNAGDTKKSMNYITQCMRLGYAQERTHLLLGLCYEKDEEYKKAIDELRIAQKIYPYNSQIKTLLSSCYEQEREDLTRKRL